MDSEKVIKRDNEYVLHTYNRNPIVLEKGHGLRAAGPEGQQYLDFTSGIGVNSLGYCDLDWAEAVSEQAHKLQHTSNLYYTAPCGKLAKKLCKRTGMSKVFFGNSLSLIHILQATRRSVRRTRTTKPLLPRSPPLQNTCVPSTPVTARVPPTSSPAK